MTARNVRVLLLTGAFLAGLVICFGVVLIVTGRVSAPVAQQIAAIGGPFKLTDQNGRTVTDQDMKGHPFLVFFGFTHCPDVCPTTLFEVSQILRALGPDADRVRALFITVDPERDKGPVLRTFTEAFDKRLIGLGGTVEQIRDAADALGISFKKVVQGNSSYVVDHSSSYVLIDPSRVRAQTLLLAEPHLLAAKLIEVLTKAGVPLDNVNNIGAYR
jgi:protein SCO1/2